MSEWLSRVECVTNSVYSCSDYSEQVAMLLIRYLYLVHELKCSCKFFAARIIHM